MSAPWFMVARDALASPLLMKRLSILNIHLEKKRDIHQFFFGNEADLVFHCLEIYEDIRI